MRSPRLAQSPLRTWRSHDVSDVSHSSASSGSSSSVGKSSTSSTLLASPTERNPVKIAARAIGMCFGSPKSEPATPHLEEPAFLGTPIGSGAVYKAQLADGTMVAVKHGRKNGHDRNPTALFQNEIQTLARIEHLNLVRLHGFAENDDERIIVVEYVPNGTLRDHLDCERGKPLDLAARLDVAIDVAHAVTYLHMYSDQPIIHRDIKSSNILLTDNLRAKVADFGLARVGKTDSEMSHVLTQVKGTAGYLDPEYLRTCQLTEKSDVYSFGVLLVELVTGRPPIQPKRNFNERTTIKWAMKKFS